MYKDWLNSNVIFVLKYIYGNQITDGGMKYLANCKQIKYNKLQYLNHKCNISNLSKELINIILEFIPTWKLLYKIIRSCKSFYLVFKYYFKSDFCFLGVESFYL